MVASGDGGAARAAEAGIPPARPPLTLFAADFSRVFGVDPETGARVPLGGRGGGPGKERATASGGGPRGSRLIRPDGATPDPSEGVVMPLAPRGS